MACVDTRTPYKLMTALSYRYRQGHALNTAAAKQTLACTVLQATRFPLQTAHSQVQILVSAYATQTRFRYFIALI